MLFLLFMTWSCQEKKTIVPRPDSILSGWVTRADEFRRTIDTSHAGIKVWVDDVQAVTNSMGRFQVNLGQRTSVSKFKCLDTGTDTMFIPFSSIRLKYEGEFQQTIFMIDTVIHAQRSNTIIDSVYFQYQIDTNGRREYQFVVQINPSQEATDRGANLRLGNSPGQALSQEFGQLLFQQTALNTVTFYFSDSIIAPGVGRFLPGSTVYFVANGTSANTANTSFWRETSLFRMGLNWSKLQSTPVRQVVLP